MGMESCGRTRSWIRMTLGTKYVPRARQRGRVLRNGGQRWVGRGAAAPCQGRPSDLTVARREGPADGAQWTDSGVPLWWVGVGQRMLSKRQGGLGLVGQHSQRRRKVQQTGQAGSLASAMPLPFLVRVAWLPLSDVASEKPRPWHTASWTLRKPKKTWTRLRSNDPRVEIQPLHYSCSLH